MENSGALARFAHNQKPFAFKVAVFSRIGRYEGPYPKQCLKSHAVYLVEHGLRVGKRLRAEFVIALVFLPAAVYHKYPYWEFVLYDVVGVFFYALLVLVALEFNPRIVLGF